MAEILEKATDEESDLPIRLANFLNAFYADGDPGSQRARLDGEPRRVDDERTNAFVGAIGEHLCRRWMLGPAPEWSDADFRFLRMPWFTGGEAYRLIHLKESPSAFRRRMIFTEAEPLRRATMPRDRRWWFYEALRTGMTPSNDDVAPARGCHPSVCVPSSTPPSRTSDTSGEKS